jgi:hypothetical protein
MVSVTETGPCEFRMYMPHAGSVELVGTFCDWQPERGGVELECDADGWWTARVSLAEGDHEFCYLVDGRIWMPDYAAGGVRRSATGRWVSLLSVPPGPESGGRPVGALAEPRIGRSVERESIRSFVHA